AGLEVKLDGRVEDVRTPLSLRTGRHQLLVYRGDRIEVSEPFLVHRGVNPTLRVALRPPVTAPPDGRSAAQTTPTKKGGENGPGHANQRRDGPTLGTDPGPKARGSLTSASQVRKLFQDHCLECHGGAKPKAGMRILDRVHLVQKGRVVPGQP